jgi:hypothetical protein
LKKYEVTIQFIWQAETRKDVWREVREYVDYRMRDLADVISVSTNQVDDPENWIALNESIQGKKGTD